MHVFIVQLIEQEIKFQHNVCNEVQFMVSIKQNYLTLYWLILKYICG